MKRAHLSRRIAARCIALSLLLAVGCETTPPRSATDERRIVVLAPAVGEMLDALGLGDDVVGIGRVGPWPDSMVGRPVVGDFDRPNVERVIELGATHLLSTRSAAALDAHERLERMGVEVLALETGSFESVFDAIAHLGERFEAGEVAERLIVTIRGELAEVEARAARRPRRSVLLVVGREPLFVAGPGSHLDVLARIAGGDNVFADLQRSYAQVSLEAALERRPEVIVDASGGGDAAGRHWREFDFLPAVRDDRVHIVDPASVSIPGIDLPAIAARLERCIASESAE